jgi:hypothetical protein
VRTTIGGMSKKRKKEEPAPEPARKKVVYVEVDPLLKERLDRLAALRSRKITAEAILALRRYLDEEEAKEGLPPLGGKE